MTDAGMVFTALSRGGRNAFEYLLIVLVMQQKNSLAHHPQTQREIESILQTLKKMAGCRSKAKEPRGT